VTEIEWKASGLYGVILFSMIAAAIYGFGWDSNFAKAAALILGFILHIVTRLNARYAETKIQSIRD
jgi:hypothetical protein